MKKVCMIPARLGSQRLKQKNLLKINNMSIVQLCAKKCIDSSVFDEVYINSESDIILQEAPPSCYKYKRNEKFANNQATSEDFVRDFISNVQSDYLFQIHSIAPLITVEQISSFVEAFVNSNKQVGLTYEKIILESLVEEKPVNFTFKKKSNSQDLKDIHVINWAMTGWNLKSDVMKESCISFGSDRFFFELPRFNGSVIKTEQDYNFCKKILEL